MLVVTAPVLYVTCDQKIGPRSQSYDFWIYNYNASVEG
jgi:hypothetical protein